jgi:hypothetical protein
VSDAALDIAARCAQVATFAAEENLRSLIESDSTRGAQRRVWRTRLLLRRAPITEGSAPP